ncbi:putative phosphotransferase enzyme IIB component [bioreactor metagenome]|uniref:Putative phosphotransferase enzyme IIB component n=1 Tax=bioreactor metagenome TaxID=1076179 RepID=A0A645EQM1_9ZZZZ
MMAAPSTCKVAIKHVDEAIELLNDPRGKNLRMMGIVSNPDDLLRVVEQVKDIDLVNIGNYGRIASKRNGVARRTVDRNLYVYDDEVETLRKVIKANAKCIYQTTPDETPESLTKLLGL